MKNVKIIYLLTLLLMVAVVTSYGQKNVLDSVCIQIENDFELDIAIYDYDNLYENVEKDFKNLQAILKNNPNIPRDASYVIAYESDKLLSLKPGEPGDRIIWENGKSTNYQFNNECKLESDKYLLSIKFNELDKLLSDNLLIKLKEIIDTTNAIQSRMSAIYNYSYTEDQFEHNTELDEINSPLDMILLKGGVGVSLIKNQPVIDLSGEIGVGFSKKGVLKNQYYFAYNQLSDFTADSKINLNGFMNVGFRYNLSKTKDKPNWLGVEFGYLVKKNGDMFGENTFKLGVNWEIGKYISVTPQLYFSDNFNQTYPAVRIGFGI